jgi:LacI family gluconate utilization system Gnt-I transcriptional repressor
LTAAEYLFRKGRRRVAVISGEDERAARRTKAFVAAAERLGLPPPVVKWVSVPTTLADGREGLAELLRRETDAVSCSSDLLALGVLTEAHARGVAVPGSLAVIGFGNLPFAAGVIPSLTTVHIDGVRIGRTAAELIIARAAGEKVKHSHVDVSFSIIPRDSA